MPWDDCELTGELLSSVLHAALLSGAKEPRLHISVVELAVVIAFMHAKAVLSLLLHSPAAHEVGSAEIEQPHAL